MYMYMAVLISMIKRKYVMGSCQDLSRSVASEAQWAHVGPALAHEGQGDPQGPGPQSPMGPHEGPASKGPGVHTRAVPTRVRGVTKPKP